MVPAPIIPAPWFTKQRPLIPTHALRFETVNSRGTNRLDHLSPRGPYIGILLVGSRLQHMKILHNLLAILQYNAPLSTSMSLSARCLGDS